MRSWIALGMVVLAAACGSRSAGGTSLSANPAPTAVAGARTSPAVPSDAPVSPRASADASALYDAGTEALARGDLGRAVAFLLAAHRIEPRARDIRTNLAIARARVEAMQGSAAPDRVPLPSVLALSPAEAWGMSAALALLGALLGWAAALRPRPGPLLLAATAAMGIGIILWGALLLRAREEARHPEAVVVGPVLNVMPAPDERPLPPYLLAAGEEVRLGRSRDELVEIRVGGNSIGWAPRSGLWRVADAARYTASSGSD